MDLLIYVVPHSCVFSLQLGAVFQDNVHFDVIFVKTLKLKVQSWSVSLSPTHFLPSPDNLKGDFWITA